MKKKFLVILAVVVVALMLASPMSATASVQTVTRTINLNTGWDQWLTPTPALIPPAQKDNEWRVTLDPTVGNPSPPERSTDVVGSIGIANPSGGANYPDSGWISINPGSLPAGPSTTYEYTYYFTLPPGFSSPQLTMQLNAGDIITQVRINNTDLNPAIGGDPMLCP